MKTLAELARLVKLEKGSIVCTSCPATAPSLTIAKAAGWKRFKWDVYRYFVCPMCAQCEKTGNAAIEIPLEER